MISINTSSHNLENKENYDPENRISSRAGTLRGNNLQRRTKIVQTPSRRIKRVPLMEIILNRSLNETEAIHRTIQTSTVEYSIDCYADHGNHRLSIFIGRIRQTLHERASNFAVTVESSLRFGK
ncbi:13117_t:CDS:2 [Cetraspora pellucida]|uniref:13117_t:CDS:1 n=1 Tax=Cetraspora pellucida TaxID=1433469 RepID=A0ACA9K2H3_9GLOM|nr:13117_t:CDS:2 [Cetraspora pellucida]